MFAKLSVTSELAGLLSSRPTTSGRNELTAPSVWHLPALPRHQRGAAQALWGRNSPMWRCWSRGFCREACEVEAWAGREPAGPARSLGRTRQLRGCPAQPRPTSLAALTVVVTRPGLETISWWASVWGGLWPAPVQGADVLEGAVPFPGCGR